MTGATEAPVPHLSGFGAIVSATIRAISASYLEERPVHIECGELMLSGSLGALGVPLGVVLIANDTGAARHRACELELARALRRERFATLMVDVITAEEHGDPESAARLRVNAMKLAHRIAAARAWIAAQPELRGLPVAIVGEGGAGAAAIIEAAAWPHLYGALVLREAQPLKAGLALEQCALPVMLVADANHPALVSLNQAAIGWMCGEVHLLAIAGAVPSTIGERDSEISSRLAGWLAAQLILPRAPRLALPPQPRPPPDAAIDR